MCPNCGNPVSATNPEYCPHCDIALRATSMPVSQDAPTVQDMPSAPPIAALPMKAHREISPLFLTIVVLLAVIGGGLGGTVGTLAVTGKLQLFGAHGTSIPTQGYTILYRNALTTPTNDWPDNGTSCFFGTGGYHMRDGYACYGSVGGNGNGIIVTDGIVSVTVKQIAGPTTAGFGISFRRPSNGNRYDFDITSGGQWAFAERVQGTFSNISNYASSSAIHQGLNATNTLSVIMHGSSFMFFVNKAKVGQITDTTFATGMSGVHSDSGGVGDEEVFTDFEAQVPVN
jgi:hypothetical protein